jgi:hypothetical protein
MRGRHKRSRLFTSRQYEFSARAAQRFDDVQIFFAGHGENSIDAFVL